MKSKHLELTQAFWDNRAHRESKREKQYPGKQIHTDLLRREISRCIGRRKKLRILDAGAGTGRFSIPLAIAGHHVVHLDISPKMIAVARRSSKKRNLRNIEFIQASVDDLSRFTDNSFDLVLCLDAPLSLICHRHKKAMSELVRVARNKIVVSVFNRHGLIAQGVNFDLKFFGKLKTVPPVYKTGTLKVTERLKKLQPSLLPDWHAFTPDEIQRLFEENGCRMIRMSAPGTVSRFVDTKLLKNLLKKRKAYKEFLHFEEKFDEGIYQLGIGSLSGSGLLATAQKLRCKKKHRD
jgi:ubiquinone/menaquinone biosynthesis C-methylase UbiE